MPCSSLVPRLPVALLAGPVCDFLMSAEYGAKRIRLAEHVTHATVLDWLTAASKCGLQPAVKLCIDFIVDQQMPVAFKDLSGLTTNNPIGCLQRCASVVKGGVTLPWGALMGSNRG